MTKLFVSYRRSDSGAYADRIVERLRAFGFDVFQDRSGIELGEQFPDEIRTAIAEAAAMVVLIGPTWLDARNTKGERRLHDPADWVRREIALMESTGRLIVPIFFDGAQLDEADLPEELRFLPLREGYPISGNFFDRDSNDFCARLETKLLGRAAGDAPPPRRHVWAGGAQLQVLLMIALLSVTTVAFAIAPARFPALPAVLWVLPGSMLFTAFVFLLFLLARSHGPPSRAI